MYKQLFSAFIVLFERKSTMRFLVVFASVILAINAASDSVLWADFKQKFGRSYRSVREEQRRFAIFQNKLRIIEAHNEKYENGESTYYMGINQFSDMTEQEFRNMRNYSASIKSSGENPNPWFKSSGAALPESIDWVAHGQVVKPKPEWRCLNCLEFSATGALEGAHARKTGKLVSLSEQNLVDCSTADGEGNVALAYEYIRHNGIESEKDYPYSAKKGNCQFNPALSVTNVSTYVNVERTEAALQEAVANVGPISVLINGNHLANYAGGVFDEDACDGSTLNQGVLVVGYGEEDGVPYWKVKNFWGANWGENGYIKMVRNKNDQCGIALSGIYPIV